MAGECLVFRLLEKEFASQKVESRRFYSCYPVKFFPQVLIITLPPRRGKLPITPRQRFFEYLQPLLHPLLSKESKFGRFLNTALLIN